MGYYGDGGGNFTHDDDLAQACGLLTMHGEQSRYHHVRVGMNGRLDTIQAAQEVVSLPFSPWLSESDKTKIISGIVDALTRIG